MAPIEQIFAVILLVIPTCFAILPLPDHFYNSVAGRSTFRWSDVEPSKELTYHTCFESFRCARLLVPLDWQAPEASRYNQTVALAIIKLPARVSTLNTTYGGAVITNPGGPGGSGIEHLLSAGTSLQWAVDSDSKHFDIVSFDPRGVLHSGPDASCFPSPLTRDLWNIKIHEEGNLDSGNRAIGLQWARAKAFGKMCADAEIGDYMGSASVARDILEIVERIHEHHHKTISAAETGLASESVPAQSPLVGKERDDIGTPMLQYLGFSYGTFLGNTFASMFPDRVKRMVLDGVVDAPDYMAQGWSTNLQDTDKVMDAFYKYCFEAGSLCPLYDRAGPEAIKSSLSGFLQMVQENPIVAVDSSGSLTPDILTYSDIRRFIFMSLYSPVRNFPGLAFLLDQLRNGEYDQALRLMALQTDVHCPRDNSTAASQLLAENEAPRAIMCGDGDDMSNQTLPDFKEYLRLLEAQSSTGGAIWASFRLICTGWQVRSKWRYTGPFGGNTSKPILWIGNTADPVTPIRNAHKMAKNFPGSVVLQADSVGHCSLFNRPSNCTLEVIRQYFSSGALPEMGTVCPADRNPFDSNVFTPLKYSGDGNGQVHILDSLKYFQWRRFPLGI
ncbi:hypothetical protein EPUS_00189 [Endocarpon pusillum Z07020]|uniref:Peptidase S33 tripeptidyl aminopeptidase-like C-terminal domain-containing protein n=1 Tax=Endocarpon pusillum (strain Z07020 / HMAS-L-300199) TaxID=1263415 RepID=U1GTP8_ENDPU|nr:uncharacterized protein EPUS_00189 [Endocarpon pusillum Z07020]ERF75396.1 hypothetical protein EPUS_00189 [Endocarpon pusillum Z07020]